MEYYEINHFLLNPKSVIVLGDQGLRKILNDTIYMVPKDILDDFLVNCVFLMLSEKCEEGEFKVPACFIPNKLIKDKNICAFYEMLYCQDRDEQVRMVLHEIAHYVLDHIDEGLSKEEYIEQEKKADSLRDKWLDDWEKHDRALREEAMKPWKGGD